MLLSGAAVSAAVRASPVPGRLRACLAWLGRRSYSGYLVHLLVIVVLLKVGGNVLVKQLGPVDRLLLFAAATGITVAAMHLMYQWVEKPAQRWARSWLKARMIERDTSRHSA
jgi:peptidoglycan/LPS O-acetylase OafA/YrhL